MKLYDESMLAEWRLSHPDAPEDEILAFLAGIQCVLDKLHDLALNNQLVIIPPDADNRTFDTTNIIQFPGADDDT